MVSEGDEAPDFTAPEIGEEIETVTLSEVYADGPVVLAFFPGAFTRVCSHEMNVFEDRLERFEQLGATVYGVSTNSPYALEEFRDKLGLSFGLISDVNREIVGAYGNAMDFGEVGENNAAKRSVYVVDRTGTITYAWESDDPGVEPDYDAIESAVADTGSGV